MSTFNWGDLFDFAGKGLEFGANIYDRSKDFQTDRREQELRRYAIDKGMFNFSDLFNFGGSGSQDTSNSGSGGQKKSGVSMWLIVGGVIVVIIIILAVFLKKGR